MASLPDHPCRAALIEALALLDHHSQQGAACYVAMALDCLDGAGGERAARAASPRAPESPAIRIAAAHRP